MKNKEIVETKQKEEKDKRRLIVLILGITTLLFALIGATFAYFSKVVNSVNGNQSMVIGATVLEGLTYKASDTLTLTNAIPGDKVESTFTVTNPNSKAKVRYTLKVVSDLNEFTNVEGDNQLMVEIYDTNGTLLASADFTDGEHKKEEILLSNIELLSKQSDVYKAKIEFKELGTNQISNKSKDFTAHIEIVQSIVVDTEYTN